MASRIAVVRDYFQRGSRPVETSEFMIFWKACTEAERAEFSASAARELDVVLDTDMVKVA